MFLALVSPSTRSFRSLFRTGLVATALAAVLVGPALAAAQDSVVEIYDARDLAVLIASPPGGQSVATDKSAPAVGSPSPFWMRTPSAGPATDKLDQLFGSIVNVTGAGYSQLMPGVFAVTTDRETHTTVRAMLAKVRGMSEQRYEFDLVVYPVPVASAPALGGAVTPDAAAVGTRIRTTAMRRLPQTVEALKRVAYISDWMPVVADNAVGNDPTTSEVVSGLSCIALIGAGPDSSEVVNLQLTGRLSRASVAPGAGGAGKAMAATGPASEGLGIGLPVIDERSISVDLPITVAAPNVVGARLTAVAVLPGFEEGQSLVVAVGIREIK